MEINTKVSSQLLVMLFLLHLGAVLIVFKLVQPLPLATVIAAVLGVSLARQCLRFSQAAEDAVRRIFWAADGQVLLIPRSGQTGPAYQLAGSRIFAGAIILTLTRAGRKRPVYLLLPRDALDPEDARKLRVEIRSLTRRPPEATA